MKKLLKPANLAFNLLSLVVFFLFGMYFASWIEAGKGQGLAGGAIVFGYGVMFAVVAFIASFFMTYYLERRKIVMGNWILLAFLLLGFSTTFYRMKKKEKERKENNKPYNQSPTGMLEKKEFQGLLISDDLDSLDNFKNEESSKATSGMGFFAPDFINQEILYFYGDPNLMDNPFDQVPYDSLVFQKDKNGNFEISYAPPWFVPEISKMDYGFLMLRVESVTSFFTEVRVNQQLSRTAFVSNESGGMLHWSDFLLSINSVEFMDKGNQEVHARPFKESGKLNANFEFMKPIKVKEDWAFVKLLDDEFQEVTRGWIKWIEDGELLVNFNLLS